MMASVVRIWTQGEEAMLPSRFEYHRPATLDEALGLLASNGEDAKVLAGGQSLIPLMKLRFAAPDHLIDVNRIEGLDGISESDGTLRIGALVRHNALAASDVIAARYPTLAAAAPQIADPIVRNLGTIGGSLSHADPAGDLGSVMLALGASVVLSSSTGEREVPVSEFLVDMFQTSIAPAELLTEVRVPAPPARSGGAYLKLERKVGDFASVAAATFLAMDNGSIAGAGIGLTSVGTTNIKATAAEQSLVGAAPDERAFAEAGRLAAEAANPVQDVRGGVDYKRHMVDVYVRRGLARAAEMAGAA
jgi:aerobic carbon-monoxide dehydrogenase medium subunit